MRVLFIISVLYDDYDTGDALFVLMERLIEHIERLLLQHDCVIIPDFGGFVLQSVSAVYMGEEHSFTPTRKEIVFNPTLTHNDGLLVESYMQEYSKDFDKARQLVGKDVAEIKEVLSNYSELQFGTVGLFTKEDERVAFMQGKNSDMLFSTQSYGLPVFHYLPLSARNLIAATPVLLTASDNSENTSIKADKRGKNVIYNIPVTRTFVRTIAVAAAVILLFLFISTPVSDVNKSSYTASFVPHEIMPAKSVDDVVSGAFSSSGNMAALSDTEYVSESAFSVEKNARETEGVIGEAARETEKPVSEPEVLKFEPVKEKIISSAKSSSKSSSKSTTAKPLASNVVGAKYYVMIASFESKARAQTYIKQLKGSKEAATAKVLVRDGRARVYAQSFSSEKDAQSYMAKLHENPKHKQAWIYEAK